MTIQPISLAVANALVADWHRHSKPVVGHLYSLGLFDEDLTIHGAAIVGRPTSRHLQARGWIEITRLVTDGTRNACSRLYAAACREARRRGCPRVVTYTLATETGASLRAAGFTAAGHTKGRQWGCESRPRQHREAPDRTRWERRP